MNNDFATEAICHAAEMARETIQSVASRHLDPDVLWRPRIFPDGNMWCALYGDNLMEGVAGFGETPEKAMEDFNKNWRSQTLKPAVHICGRCGEPNPEYEVRDGCRDPHCPEQGTTLAEQEGSSDG